MKAYALHEQNPDGDQGKRAALMREAWDIDPEESHYGRIIAKQYIHAGKYDEALNVIRKTLKLRQSFREICHSRLITAITYDLKGERETALKIYREIEALSEQKQEDDWFGMNRFMLGFVRKYMKHPFTKDNLGDESVAVDYIDPLME